MVVTSDKHHYLTNLNRTLPKCAVSFPTLRKKNSREGDYFYKGQIALFMFYSIRNQMFQGRSPLSGEVWEKNQVT